MPRIRNQMRDIDMPPEKPPLLILRIIISKNLNAQLIACHNAQIIHGRTFNLQDFRRKQLVEFHDILIKHPIIVRVVVIFKDIVNAAACYKQNALVRKHEKRTAYATHREYRPFQTATRPNQRHDRPSADSIPKACQCGIYLPFYPPNIAHPSATISSML